MGASKESTKQLAEDLKVELDTMKINKLKSQCKPDVADIISYKNFVCCITHYGHTKVLTYLSELNMKNNKIIILEAATPKRLEEISDVIINDRRIIFSLYDKYFTKELCRFTGEISDYKTLFISDIMYIKWKIKLD